MPNKKISDKEFSLLQEYIRKNCGIELGPEKAYLVESRLSRLLIDYRLNGFQELYELLSQKSDRKIHESLIDAITTNETMWFRDKSPWEVIEEVLLPKYVEEFLTGKRKRIRIWSAAASTGQEAYSTAMLIDKYLRKRQILKPSLQNFEIIGTDISPSVLQVARMARYDSISIMRGLDDEYKKNYFFNQGRTWELDERIKKAVRFRTFNLQDSFTLLGKFDIVFLRYILIYFADELKDNVSRKSREIMEKEGVLFVGNSEIFQNKEALFEQKTLKNAVYYQVKG